MPFRSKVWAATVIAVVAAFAAVPASAAGQAPSQQELARQILADDGVVLLKSHVGGQDDPESTAWRNVKDTSEGRAARTSPWSDVGVEKVELSAASLEAMAAIGKDYDYRVTTIAGGDHSSTSYHYAGTAFDIDQIDGKAVSSSNPKVGKIKSACQRLGAVEILGPGDAGHDTHLHCAWQR